MSASHRKSTQVHASLGQTESQVEPSFQLASTCDSVWPGLKNIFILLCTYVLLQSFRSHYRLGIFALFGRRVDWSLVDNLFAPELYDDRSIP